MAATTLAEIDPTPKDIEWVTRELSKLCDFASDDMAKYLLKVDDPVEYIEGTVGDSKASRGLSRQLKSRRTRLLREAQEEADRIQAEALAGAASPLVGTLYRKDDDDDGMLQVVPRSRGRRNRRQQQAAERTKAAAAGLAAASAAKPPMPPADSASAGGSGQGAGMGSKPSPPAPLSTPRATAAAGPAKPASASAGAAAAAAAAAAPAAGAGGPKVDDASRFCTCQATLHALLTNCMNCGKIICEMEAGHTCSFCGHDLGISIGKKGIANARRRALKQSKQHITQFNLPAELANDEALMRAVAHKDRLLLFDRTSAQRSHVYDDQADYFSHAESTWLSDKERKDAQDKDTKRREARKVRPKAKLSFDFTGRVYLDEVDASPTPAAGATAAAAPSPVAGTRIGKAAESDSPQVYRVGGDASESKSEPVAPRSDSGSGGEVRCSTEKLLRSEGMFLGSGAGVGDMLALVSEPRPEEQLLAALRQHGESSGGFGSSFVPPPASRSMHLAAGGTLNDVLEGESV